MKKIFSVIFVVFLVAIGGCDSGKVAVTGISFEENAVVLTKNETYTLKYSLEPGDANNKNVLWSSTNPECVRVDQEGVVEALEKGTSIISVVTEDGNYEAFCSVEVKNDNADILSLEFNHGSLEPEFSSEQLEYTVTVENEIDSISFQVELADEDSELICNDKKMEKIPLADELSLNIGENIIELRVVAEDGMTERTYIIRVIRKKQTLEISASYKGEHSFLGDEEFLFDFIINDSSVDKIKIKDGNVMFADSYSPTEIDVEGKTESSNLVYVYPSEDEMTLAAYSKETEIKTYTIDLSALR